MLATVSVLSDKLTNVSAAAEDFFNACSGNESEFATQECLDALRKEILRVRLVRVGETVIDFDDLKLYRTPEQMRRALEGDVLRFELKNEPDFTPAGQDIADALVMHPELVPEGLKHDEIIFWAEAKETRNGHEVIYLVWNGQRMIKGTLTTKCSFGADRPALALKCPPSPQ